ncbi:FAD-dependent oxidoreductase [Sphingobacterium tabacisoli]|uniref:FAD-dependent oxidoreductase n=1 Tax=Sphingobacterium tabacisoli TaxID=2044855 RepID=A0ABW5L7G5_9SPHI|nr:FAD-dependent oxidoreductase [Sphingobacterium tabacisoli]
MIYSTGGKKRTLKTEFVSAELVIVGGGLAGVCAAITAARQDMKVVLIQDRSVLGGNASSEVRLWILGATSHMGNNNRWSREGGVIDELLVENMYRNPEGNAVILDMIMLDKVKQEKNITLLLNTAVYEIAKEGEHLIKEVYAYCSQNSTQYQVKSPLFCDASGDGVLGFLSGAAFRMGAESKEEFDELMAPDTAYGELLGHTLYFYTKDTGSPVSFIPPAFAIDVTKEVPRFKNFNAKEHGCKLWWVEYGGRLDTVHDTEEIKWELWKVIYGVWDYIKNSGNFPEADTLTLEWVGMIPGKRESRRFEGDYIMSQKDLVEQRTHGDAVAFGGWSIDLHPADGVFSEKQPCNQWHSKGLFQIPYRSLYSKNIHNLFLAGRIISVSHVAFGATRVMATCAYVAQATAVAAALCHQYGVNPRALNEEGKMDILQRTLMKTGQHIPGLCLQDRTDLMQQAHISASSTLYFYGFDSEGLLWKNITTSVAQMIPVMKGQLPVFNIQVEAVENTVLQVHIATSLRLGNFTPEIILGRKEIQLTTGKHDLSLDFELDIDNEQYIFLTFLSNENIRLPYSQQRITGMLSVFNGKNKAVSNNGKQVAVAGSGVDSFEFWTPQRRPEGHNLVLQLSNPLNCFSIDNIRNGIERPTTQPNAWVADPSDVEPKVKIRWDERQVIQQIDICFDTDFDHAMESVLMTHPERRMPFCIKRFRIEDDQGNVIYKEEENYRTRRVIQLEYPCETHSLTLFVDHPSADVPASLFAIRCY